MALSRQKARLLEEVGDAIRSSGWKPLFMNTNHPSWITAVNGAQSVKMLVYIWSMTPGGPSGVRPEEEIRIQLTGVAPPFQRGTDFHTLLLGYDSNLEVFSGFDVSRRPQEWGSSPSVQTRTSSLLDAQQNGFGFYRRKTRDHAELAVAFRPDAFMDYVTRQAEIHFFADRQEDVEVLKTVSRRKEQDPPVDLDAVNGEGRKAALRTVMERVGQQNFRNRILAAYSHSCAVCDLQLQLVDAAHILPVLDGGSNETINGICLCKLHHTAYDQGLVGLMPDFKIAVNEAKARYLKSRERAGGLLNFRYGLRTNMRKPSRPQDRPAQNLLERGLQIRGWNHQQAY